MHCFFALGIVTVQWAVIGYSLAFGTTHGGLIGGFDYLVHARRRARRRRTQRARCRTSRSWRTRCMFAVITPALISGAFAERMKFSAYCAVHARVDDAGLRSDRALGVGRRRLARQARRARLRRRHGRAPVVGHLGAGRRARARQAPRLSARAASAAQPDDDRDSARASCGSAGSASTPAAALARTALAALAFVNTHLAAAAGALAWGLVEWLRIKKADDARRRVGAGRRARRASRRRRASSSPMARSSIGVARRRRLLRRACC